MTIRYTSDLHFGHTNILTYEPSRFTVLGLSDGATVADMNDGLVDWWNATVSDADTTWVLGDLCMGKVAETLQWVSRLRGQIKLVPGNHDRMHPIMHKSDAKTAEWVAAYEAVGVEVASTDLWQEFDGQVARVCHFPYDGDHTENERYPGFRPDDEGLPLVHGHVHGLWQTRGRQFNVGFDAWGRFITPQEIGDWARSLKH